MATPVSQKQYFLGVNVGTGTTSGTLITRKGTVWKGSIPHSGDLAKRYGLLEGFFQLGPGAFYAPPLLWVDAFEELLRKLKAEMGEAAMPLIGAVKIAAQQHGQFWVDGTFDSVLAGLDPSKPLGEQIEPALTLEFCPMWMNSATGRECEEMADALSPTWWARVTGSVPTRRFPGPQIRRLARLYPDNYRRTATIGLVNCLLTSLLAQRTAPIDRGEAFASNMANLRRRTWSEAALREIAPGLQKLLAPIAPPDYFVGPVGSYCREHYGFDNTCDVYVGAGDNNASILGSGVVEPGEEVLSIGTSITRLCVLDKPPKEPNLLAHVMASVTGTYMGMFCMSNGGRSFDEVLRKLGITLQDFDRLVAETDVRNDGKMLIPFLVHESVPSIPPRWEYIGMDEKDPASALAVVQGLLANLCLHANFGGKTTRVIATGGGSSDAVCQVAADMLGATVHHGEKDTVSLGAAIAAAHAFLNAHGEPTTWQDLTGPLCKREGEFKPRPEHRAFYDQFVRRFGELTQPN